MATQFSNGLRLHLNRRIDESYDIIIVKGVFPDLADQMQKSRFGSKYAVITDSNVERLYAGQLSRELNRAGLEHKVFSFPAGEESKNRTTSDAIIDQMHAEKYGRDACIIALGGGVVGDLAGYVAATYNRGIPLVQVPTTTISQADSSIGGKVGVDTPHGKNLVGAFKQPKIVCIDVNTLQTLPENQFVSGLAESIKHAMIGDVRYFDWLCNNTEKILKRDMDSMMHLAHNNCWIKGNVVEKDLDEKGLRRILNYGHTIGHALEKLSNYTLTHGNAVSMGMMAAGQIAVEKELLSKDALEAQRQLLVAYTLPTAIPGEFSDDAIISATRTDKKSAGGKVRYCLPSRRGAMNEFEGEYALPVEDDAVRRAIEAIRED